jgi:hypothetical protein
MLGEYRDYAGVQQLPRQIFALGSYSFGIIINQDIIEV